MERLTGYSEDGNLIVHEEERLLNANGVISKDEMYKIMRHLAERAAYYEDLEEKGLFLQVPVSKGSRVYEIVSDYATGRAHIRPDIVTEVSDSRIWGDSTYWHYEEIGTTLFLSEEAAEKMLKKMKSGKETYRRIRYRPKIVEGRITGTGWPIDGHILALSLWDYDNYESWHLFGWEEEADRAVMETVFLTETETKMCLCDALEEFEQYWKDQKWEPEGSFCIPLENVEVIKVLQEEQKEVLGGQAEVREKQKKDAAVRETWIKQHTCDFCLGRNMHTCTSYSCQEPKQKAADYYDRAIKRRCLPEKG
ncbi:MAG: hypothetical protein HFH41_03965 [Lachnospiraceae bacterium]|nr:hypothetical protein [Lachnospiraceae bacterium]